MDATDGGGGGWQSSSYPAAAICDEQARMYSSPYIIAVMAKYLVTHQISESERENERERAP